MLQQTKVQTVIPYFNNFVKKIPNLRFLASSSEKKILKLWEGLGYYRRAKNLHKTSKILIKNYKGKLPKKFDEMIKLPGVGEYTANALLAFVYNQQRIPVDGNVKRIFLRLFNLNKAKNQNFLSSSRGGDFAEALIEFGALVCKPKNPLCSNCDLKRNCRYYRNEIQYFEEKKYLIKEKKYNIFCYLKKQKKEIALKNNTELSFLRDYKMPETKIVMVNNKIKEKGWIYLCNYKNNISNIRMNINLFYKFTENKPKKFKWYPINQSKNEFIPSFTKKIFEKVSRLYI